MPVAPICGDTASGDWSSAQSQRRRRHGTVLCVRPTEACDSREEFVFAESHHPHLAGSVHVHDWYGEARTATQCGGPGPGPGWCSRINDALTPNMVLIDRTTRSWLPTHYAEQLVGFDVGDDGTLSGRRVWAALDTRPTGSAQTPKAPSGSPASPASTACASVRAARCSTPSPSIAGASPACSAARTVGRCSSPSPNGAEWRQR
jgi:hypothetical protein